MRAFSRESMFGFIGFSFACELWYRLFGKTEWRHGFVSSRADETCTLSMRYFIGNSHTIEIPRYRQPIRQRYASLSTTRALRKRHLHSVWTITAPLHPKESAATTKAHSDSQGHALQTEPPSYTSVSAGTQTPPYRRKAASGISHSLAPRFKYGLSQDLSRSR